MDDVKRTPDEKIRRGNEAERLLANPLLAEAFDMLEAGYFDGFKLAESSPEGREKLWLACQIVGKVKAHLGTAMRNGQFEQHKITEISQARKARGNPLTGAMRV